VERILYDQFWKSLLKLLKAFAADKIFATKSAALYEYAKKSLPFGSMLGYAMPKVL
jgi:hypothetical protein